MPPRRKQQGKAKASKAKAVKAVLTTSASPASAATFLYHHPQSSGLLTLLFPDTSSQHSALARIEAYYESRNDAEGYIPLSDPRVRHLCKGYEGYNFPTSAVMAWLRAMKQFASAERTKTDSDATSGGGAYDSQAPNEPTVERTSSKEIDRPWWSAYVNSMEEALLDLCLREGAILEEDTESNSEMANVADGTERASATVTYVVSAIVSSVSTLASHSDASCMPLPDTHSRCLDNPVLAHESLHYLFHVSPSYRSAVQSVWSTLSDKHRRIIAHDLSLRNYDERVHIDEWQAYIGTRGGEKEFGNVVQDSCKEAGKTLAKDVSEGWKEFGESGRSS